MVEVEKLGRAVAVGSAAPILLDRRRRPGLPETRERDVGMKGPVVPLLAEASRGFLCGRGKLRHRFDAGRGRESHSEHARPSAFREDDGGARLKLPGNRLERGARDRVAELLHEPGVDLCEKRERQMPGLGPRPRGVRRALPEPVDEAPGAVDPHRLRGNGEKDPHGAAVTKRRIISSENIADARRTVARSPP